MANDELSLVAVGDVFVSGYTRTPAAAFKTTDGKIPMPFSIWSVLT